MKNKIKYLFNILLGALFISSSAYSRDIEFPASSSGVVNIKTDYNAKGDGVTDDTQAILKAIRENIGNYSTRTIYFPSGTYVVNDRLLWKNEEGAWDCYLSFQGQNTENTIIKLADNSLGFGDFNNPKAVVYTASKIGTTSNDPKNVGAGNEAYANYIQNITIDVGQNPGAIAIDFMGNNYAGIYETKVKGNGYAGLSMKRDGAGPALVKDFEVEGFSYGILAGTDRYSVVLENINLKNQSIVGIENDQNVLSIHNLRSDNDVPALRNNRPNSADNESRDGFITLVGAVLVNGKCPTTNAAIESRGDGIILRDIFTSGYEAALKHDGVVEPGTVIDEFVPYVKKFDTGAVSLKLEIRDTPRVPNDSVDDWANVVDYQADPEENGLDWKDGEYIQNAIDSGKSTVYIPSGFYLITEPIIVRGNVRRIISPGCRIGIAFDGNLPNGTPPEAIFDIREGVYDTVEIRKVNIWNNGREHLSAYAKHTSDRTLVLRDIDCNGFINTIDSGDLFLENFAADHFDFKYPQNVWARQFNLELVYDQNNGSTYRKCLNNGGQLWVLGLKTEHQGTIIETTNGGRTEVLGGLLYPLEFDSASVPAFISEDSFVSLSYATVAYGSVDYDYKIQVRDIDSEFLKDLEKNDLDRRGYGTGSILPLFTNYTE